VAAGDRVTIRVVLADDHPVVRRGLGAMLRSVDDIDVVGEAADGHEAVRAAVTLSPDVIVLDIHMPGLDGVAAAREIRRAAPDVGILMLTMLDDDASVRAAVTAGAAGYVLKGDTQDRIVRAIHAVACGDAFLAAGVARHVMDAPPIRCPRSPHASGSCWGSWPRASRPRRWRDGSVSRPRPSATRCRRSTPSLV
jgi:DNA-binding NarL/FixJ family response regulator